MAAMAYAQRKIDHRPVQAINVESVVVVTVTRVPVVSRDNLEKSSDMEFNSRHIAPPEKHLTLVKIWRNIKSEVG